MEARGAIAARLNSLLQRHDLLEHGAVLAHELQWRQRGDELESSGVSVIDTGLLRLPAHLGGCTRRVADCAARTARAMVDAGPARIP